MKVQPKHSIYGGVESICTLAQQAATAARQAPALAGQQAPALARQAAILTQQLASGFRAASAFRSAARIGLLGPMLVVAAMLQVSCSNSDYGDDENSLVFDKKYVRINGDDPYTNNHKVTLEIEGGYATEMRVGNSPDCKDGQWESYKKEKPWTLSKTNAMVGVWVQFRSPAGLGACVTDSIGHDTLPPSIKFKKYRLEVTPHEEYTIPFELSDNLSGISRAECTLNQQPYFTPCRELFKARDLNEGQHSLQIVAYDNVGNKTRPNRFTWFVDHTAPQVQFIKGPALLLAEKKAEFLVRATDKYAGAGLSRIECRWSKGLDEIVQTAAGSNQNQRGQAGQKAQSGKAQTSQGQMGQGQMGWYNCGPQADDLSKSKFQIQFSVRSEDLKNGAHRLEVRALDLVGNISRIKSYDWSVDHESPSLKWLQTPDLYIALGEKVKFRLKAEDKHLGVQKLTYEVRENNTPPPSSNSTQNNAPSLSNNNEEKNKASKGKVEKNNQASGSNKARTQKKGKTPRVAHSKQQGGVHELSVADLPAGPHELLVYATDKVGNKSLVLSSSFVVDGQAPEVRFVSSESTPKYTNSRDILISFEAKDGASGLKDIECSHDGRAYAFCSSPYKSRATQDGELVLFVKAIDKVGNTSQPISYVIKVDTEAPTVQVTEQPLPFSRSPKNRFRFKGKDALSDIAKYICVLKQGGKVMRSQTDCFQEVTYNNLPSGEYQFEVQAEDAAGNLSTPALIQWMVDHTSPVVKWLQKPAAFISHLEPASFSIQAVDTESGVDKIFCGLEPDKLQPCFQEFSLGLLPEGAHTTYVKVIDNVGQESVLYEHQFSVDATSPQLSIDVDRSAQNLHRKSKSEIYFSATDDWEQIDFIKADCAPTRDELPSLDTSNDSAGLGASVGLDDAAGNSSEQVFMPLGQSKSCENSQQKGSGIAQTLCAFNGEDYKPCTNPAVFDTAKSGQYEVKIKTVDHVGHESRVQHYTWSVDTGKPRISFDDEKSIDKLTSETRAKIYFKAIDMEGPLKSIECSQFNTSASFKRCRSPYVIEGPLKKGPHRLFVKAVDKAGHKSLHSYAWLVDLEPPRVEILEHPDQHTQVNRASFRLRGHDDAGVRGFLCELKKDNKIVHSQAPCSADCSAEMRLTTAGGAATSAATPVVTAAATKSDSKHLEKCFTRVGLDQGVYKLSVQAEDGVGNVSQPTTYSWYVDHTPPAVRIEGSREVTQGEPSYLNLAVEDDDAIDVDSLECWLGSQQLPADNCNLHQEIRMDNAQYGEKTFRLDVADLAGNKSSVSFQYEVKRKLSAQSQDLVVNNIKAVDVLFVIDNSNSMENEQKHLAAKLQGFLDVVQGLDYRIAVTTTDMRSTYNLQSLETKKANDIKNICPGALNLQSLRTMQNGAMDSSQEMACPGAQGTLWPLRLNGVDTVPYIDAQMSLSEAGAALSQAVQDVGLKGDRHEDGVATVLSLLQRRADVNSFNGYGSIYGRSLDVPNFIRDKAHLAVVVVSDSNPPKESRQLADELRSHVRDNWPDKNFMWNSIVVLPKGHSDYDPKCKAERGLLRLIPGQAGEQYVALSNMGRSLAPQSSRLIDKRGADNMVQGIAASICAPSYTPVLRGMGERVLRLIEHIDLKCEPVDVNQDGRPVRVTAAANGERVEMDYHIEEDAEGRLARVVFDEWIDKGKYRFDYKCYANAD